MLALTAQPAGGQKLGIIAVPRLDPELLYVPEFASIRKTTGEWCLGWMNVRTAERGVESDEAVWLMYGSGSRCVGSGTLWTQRLAENRRLDHPVHLGLLADQLQKHGRTFAVTPGSALESQAALMLRSSDGTAPPVWNQISSPDLLMVVEPLRENPKEQVRTLAVALRRWTGLHPQRRWIVLTAGAPVVTQQLRRIAPILIRDPVGATGLITSPSTRTRGLITATDILPTLLIWSGITPPKGITGRMVQLPVRDNGGAQSWEEWRLRYQRMTRAGKMQARIGGLPTLQALLLMAGWAAWRRGGRGPKWAAVTGAAVLFLPVGQFLGPYLGIEHEPTALAALAVGSGLFAVFVRQTWTAAAALVVALLLDMLTGSQTLAVAWMSYSVSEGARFYGIGNEYAGALLAAGLRVAGVCLVRFGLRMRWPALAALLCIALLTGHPSAGADAGGMAGMLAGFAVAGLVWFRGRVRRADAVVVGITILACLIAMAMLDRARGGDASHIGLALRSGENLVQIVSRKAAMNGRLLLHSVWTWTLLAGGWVMWQRAREVTNWAERGAAAGVAGGAAALFFLNDSGVVAAAQCLALGAAWLLTRRESSTVPSPAENGAAA